MGDIASVKEQSIFAVLETVKGVLQMPTTADCVVLAGSANVNQAPSYTDSPEMQNTRGIISRFQDAFSAGEFSFPVVPRPNGAGVVPVGDALFESLMGKKTIVASTSVTYAQTLTKPSFTLAMRKGHVVHYLVGCTVSEIGVKVEKKGPITLDFSGKFMHRFLMGDDVLTADPGIAGATDLIVTDARRYTVGGFIQNKTLADDNAGAGYEITVINLGTNTLTITDGAAGGTATDWAISDEIVGYLPATQTVGTPIEGRHTVVKLDAVVGKLSSIDLKITDPAEYLENEINGEQFPTEYVEGDRNISGSVKSFFRKADSQKLAQAAAGTQEVTLDLETGDPLIAGSRMKIALPRVPLEVPSEEEDGPSLTLSQNFTALEINGEDSATIVFT